MTHFQFTPKTYPTLPGCYLFKDCRGRILYAGKAINLRSRLASYFRAQPEDRHLRALVRRVSSIEVILVNNETESLILENALIDRLRPPFNRLLWRADRGYPYIVLTDEEYPRFVPYHKNRLNRELGDTGIRQLLGPYLSHRFRQHVLDFVRDRYQLRTCSVLPRNVCLRFHVHKCSGICEGAVSAEQYADDITRACEFLSTSRHVDVVREMKHEMLVHADNLEFERAQRLKELIELLEGALEKQVIERDVPYDQHVLFFGEHHVLAMAIKLGTVSGMTLFDLEPASDHDEACQRFVLSRYAASCPQELIVNKIGDSSRLSDMLSAANGHDVRLTLPESGVARELLRLCQINYEYRVTHQEGNTP
jgi:excinuclease ABC subunit C